MDFLTRTETMNWETIKAFHLNPPTEMIGRLPSVEDKYTEFKNNLEEKKQTITDHILEKNGLNNSDVSYVITECDFPYNVDADHYIMWFNVKNKFPIWEDENLVMCLIRNRFPDVCKDNVAFFRNIPSKQSIKNIPHCHVFIKK